MGFAAERAVLEGVGVVGFAAAAADVDGHSAASKSTMLLKNDHNFANAA